MPHIENKFSKLELSTEEKSVLAAISKQQSALQDKVIEWSHINSGSHNRDGLKAMRAELCAAFSVLPGVVT